MVLPYTLNVPERVVAAEVRVTASSAKASVGSVPAEASNVQVIPLPDPQVVVPISVASKSMVSPSAGVPATVSIPVQPVRSTVSVELIV